MCVHVYVRTCTIYIGRYAFEKLYVYYSMCSMYVCVYVCIYSTYVVRM